MLNTQQLAILLSAFTFVVCAKESEFSSLELVQLVFRHGERTPLRTYPLDPYRSDSFWPQGWGQLTERGKGQAYALGQYIRKRYKNFLSENYVHDEIYVTSTDVQRAIMSAQSCLAGMYPTENGTEWNPSLNWQPVPLHIMSRGDRKLLAAIRGECPRYDVGYKDFTENSPPIKILNDKYKKTFEYFAQTTGCSVNNFTGFWPYVLGCFYNTISIENDLGMNIPEWAKLALHDSEIEDLIKFGSMSYTMTQDFKRLKAGPLLKLLVENINKKVLKSKTKAFMLSGHDETIVNILNTLGVFDLQMIDYASLIILELHKVKEDDYYIKLFLRNDTTKEPYKLKLADCGFECPLGTFINFVQQYVTDDWEKECKIGTGVTVVSYLKEKFSYFVTVGTTFVINNLATAGILLAYWYRKKALERSARVTSLCNDEESVSHCDDEKSVISDKGEEGCHHLGEDEVDERTPLLNSEALAGVSNKIKSLIPS